MTECPDKPTGPCEVGTVICLERRPAVIATPPRQGPWGNGSREIVARFLDGAREVRLVRNWHTGYHEAE